MRSAVIYVGHGMTLTSYGNGTSYCLSDGAFDAFFQGDDASEFGDMIETSEDLPRCLAHALADYGQPIEQRDLT